MEEIILLEIAKYCEECPIHDKCIDEECVLYRIEVIILKEEKNRSKRIQKISMER